MNKKFDQLSLPSDLYSRNYLISNGIRQYKKKKGLLSLRILDIGGLNGRLDLFLDNKDDLTILDIREGDDPRLVIGDGSDMKFFSDKSFDVVVSGDVFEHISKSRREAFISESIRVSDGLVVLAAPFDTPGVHDSEKLVNSYFRQYQGHDHQWLKEHIQNGLPDKESFLDLIRIMGYQCSTVISNDLDNWVFLQLLVFYAYRFGLSDQLINRFYRNYNSNMFQVEDFSTGAYRQVFYLSKDGFSPEFSYNLDSSKKRKLRSSAFQILSEFVFDQQQRLKNNDKKILYDLEKIHQLESLLSEGEFRRTDLEQILLEREEDIHQLNKGVVEQQSIIQNLSLQVDLKENHIQNQNLLLLKSKDAIAQSENKLCELKVFLKEKEVLLSEREEKISHVLDRMRKKNDFIRDLYLKFQDVRRQKEFFRKRLWYRYNRFRQLQADFKNSLLEISDAKEQIQFLKLQTSKIKNDLLSREKRIEDMNPDYLEFQAIKSSLSYRFLCFHRRISGWILNIFRDSRLGISLLRKQGFKIFWKRLIWYFQGKKLISDIAQEQGLSLNEQYSLFLQHGLLSDEQIQHMREQELHFSYRPKISLIVPVYNVDPKWLNKCIQSVMNQTYSNWEMCLHDDASSNEATILCLQSWEKKDSRIKISYGKKNQHISAASNHALELAIGDFVGLLDNDDELTPNALFEVVRVLNESPDIDMIYSDEDKLNMQGERIDPHFKPDWSPETFESMMYSCHFGVYRRSIVETIGGFRMGYEGSQDYDLVLRFTEHTDRIYHIPKVLYHWRMIPGSTSATTDAKSYAYDAAQKALLSRLKREHDNGRVHQGLWTGSYHVRRHLALSSLVSIIIPFKDRSDLLESCVNSVLKSTYDRFEILLISNNSHEDETFDLIQSFQQRDKRIVCHEWNFPFNFSALNNWAVKKAKGEYLLFLNNDTEVITSDWIEALLEQAVLPSTGAVGAKLLYPNNTIQHAGVVLGINGVANHAFRHMPVEWHGYFGYANVVRNYSAVTAACMMVSRQKFFDVGGFEERHLPIAYNDVDMCLKLLDKGYRNVYTPFAKLYHHESVSRENDKLVPNCRRFKREEMYMYQKWDDIIRNDPYYNPNLTRKREDFSLRIDCN